MNILENVKEEWQTQVLGCFIDMVKAPYGDFESIGKLSNAINDDPSLQLMVESLSRDRACKRAFQERPRVGQEELQKLHQLPENTLGYLYAEHMQGNGLKPIQTQQQVDDDYSFLKVHIGETHDIWHVVTGCNTNMAGEIQLEAFYVSQRLLALINGCAIL